MRIATANETYLADEALLSTRTQWAWMGILALVLLAAPFVLNNYWLYLACLVAINVGDQRLHVAGGNSARAGYHNSAFNWVGSRLAI